MSQKRAKAARRAMRERPAHIVNAEWVRRSAEAVLAVDLSKVPVTRVTQFIVGWFRAAFHQSVVIADLTTREMAPAAAPNRRLFAELGVRIHWLHDLAREDRPGAVDAMLDWERKNTEKTFKHMQDMGWDSDVDFTEMREFVLNTIENGEIRNEAEKFAAAAHATKVKNAGLFRAWREESSYAHATGYLAGSYAPADGTPWESAVPPVADSDLEAHRFTQVFIVTLVYWMLVEEGAEKAVAERIIDAFFSVR